MLQEIWDIEDDLRMILYFFILSRAIMHTNLYILIDEIVKLYVIKLGINKCFNRLINNCF